MKTSPKKLLPLTLFGIAVTSLFSIQPAQAYTVRLQQMGSNVVATGSGAVNLTGLTFDTTGFAFAAEIVAHAGVLITGPCCDTSIDAYTGFTGPTNFGSGVEFFANSGSGALVAIADSDGLLFVPQGYVSNTALSSSATWNNATFASLGVTPGTYEWTWGTGTGLANQNFTLIIGGPGVPDGGSTVSLLGFALFGLAALRRKLGC
jgi:hypothetical protein